MSILNGCGAIIDEWLGLDDTWQGQPPRYGHLATLQRLCAEDRTLGDGRQLVDALYNRIDGNWVQANAEDPRMPSMQNWRFSKQLTIADDHPGREKTLEKALARITDGNWANQVPVASGLVGPGDRQCNLDLVHRFGDRFLFIELKVDDGTPLGAAMQAIMYGCIYLLSRIRRGELGYRTEAKPSLAATSVEVVVLAPSRYYSQNFQSWLLKLQEALSNGLSQWTGERAGCTISFRFEAFLPEFEWEANYIHDSDRLRQLLWDLHQRRPLFHA